ncbi:MAG: TraR/DksA C4-type zinc finger protein [Gemmatimonadetes bacterium]|nr:TraR/DksA C4-type zinc finger protein [Gemmatimonadota bacterium]
MTPQQREHLETRLRQERDRILANLNAFDRRSRISPREGGGDLSAYPFHMADAGTDAIDQEMDFAVAESERRTLADIDEALRLLIEEPERYGRCDDCGREIPFERLDLIPWARSCKDGPHGAVATTP